MENNKQEVNIRQRKKGGSKKAAEAKVEKRKQTGGEIIYTVNDSPPWYSCILFGLQAILTVIGGAITMPLVTTSGMCIGDDEVGKSEVIATNFFVCGITTLLQVTFGTRLPILQGASPAFFPPLFAIMSLPQWQCPDVPEEFLNSSIPSQLNVTYIDWRKNVWTTRMREIQGAITMAAIFQVLVGMTGLVGFLLRFIGPLSVAPTICLIGLNLYEIAADSCSKQWGIAALTVFLIILFSQYLRNIQVPLPTYIKGQGCSLTRAPIFMLLPVFLAIVISWCFCAILTGAGALSNDKDSPYYGARTDTKLNVLDEAKWFRFPYPGQWGAPTISAAAVLGMLAGIIAGIIESVGDYYACARISEAPPPPPHAVNRGVLFEGIGCIFAGLCGTGTGVTSYSEAIGAIGITKVASRRVIQVGAFIMVILGLLGKVGAFFATIPDPIIGGLFMVVFGMITAVGVSNLQFVNLNSSRNLFVFGFSLFLGFSFPNWLSGHPEAIYTSVPTLDQIIRVLLGTPMFVGGFVAFILDNTIPGTLEERGITKWLSSDKEQNQEEIDNVYGFPIGMSCLRKSTLAKYIPFCPTYNPSCLQPKVFQEDEDEDEAVGMDLGPQGNHYQVVDMPGTGNGFSVDVNRLTRL